MPEYTETVVQATTSRRCFAVHLSLPRGGAGRNIVFEEEEVSVVGTKITRTVSGAVGGPLVPADPFPVINPTTGVPTGANSTVGTLYGLLMSLYADLSAKRDAAGG
jgi:hypothetical protein